MKNKNYRAALILFGIVLLSTHITSAQLSKGPRAELAAITRTNPATGWIYFKDNLQLTPEALFHQHKQAFALNADDEMRFDRSMEMHLTGMQQYKYQQYYKNIKVHGAVANLYLKDGIVVKANGRLVHDLHKNTIPSIGEDKALASVLAHLPANDYGWTDIRYIERYRKSKKDPAADPSPHGELMFMYKRERSGYSAEDYRLCWKFDVPMTRSTSYTVFVDAEDASIINKLPLTHSCGPTNVTTPFNGVQTIYTSQRNTCNNSQYWELTDDCGVLIEIIDDNFGGTETPICNSSSSNTWPVNTGGAGDGMQLNFGMRKTYNFFLSYFSWNSYDDGGGSLDCRIKYEFTDDNGNPTGNNASYDSFNEDFDFGYGTSGTDATDSYTTLDIVGHEFTHGVDDYTADLDYQDESGAMDESFADIFGEVVEVYTEGTQPAGVAWKVGNDKSTGSIRNMADPISFGDPDTYLGTNWYSGSNDNGGVHTNSGVQNHCFYLMCEGGSGYNSNGDYYNVSAIGIADAKEIAFLAHQYLWGTADYIDGRDAWLEAASDIYGSCSSQAIQTGNAWYAVGVGAQSPFNTQMVMGTIVALVGDATFQAIESVFTTGNVEIVSTSGGPFEARFLAGVDVTLNVGFTAESGTAFVADINPCSITLHNALRTLPPPVVIPSSIEKVKETTEVLKITASPNPFKEMLRLDFESDASLDNATITVFDLNGRIVYKEDNFIIHNGQNSKLLELAILQEGIYFLEVTHATGRLARNKVIKMK